MESFKLRVTHTKLAMLFNQKKNSRSGNRTPGASVTGSNVTNYTNRDRFCEGCHMLKHLTPHSSKHKKFPDRELNPGLTGESRVS